MSEQIAIDFKFEFNGGETKLFGVALNRETLAMTPLPGPVPEWARLTLHQCPSCAKTGREFCPVAANLAPLVEYFKERLSYEEVNMTVTTEARTYSKRTNLEEGLCSLLRFYLYTSGCPVLDRLRPLLETQLPFPTPQESLSQILSLFLLGNHLTKAQAPAYKDLPAFVALLKEVQEINASLIRRLNTVATKDAIRNAMVLLNNLIYIPTKAIENQKLQQLERLFIQSENDSADGTRA
jgi:hypothetical protein